MPLILFEPPPLPLPLFIFHADDAAMMLFDGDASMMPIMPPLARAAILRR